MLISQLGNTELGEFKKEREYKNPLLKHGEKSCHNKIFSKE